jgi:malate synthase
MSRVDARPFSDEAATVLSAEALEFLGELAGRFGPRRLELLAARTGRGAPADFLAETAEIRADDSWRVAEPTRDYGDRRVEITGPTDRKLVINALNSGARGFMADFEDANSPTWRSQVEGQANVRDAILGTITYESSDGRLYELGADTATLLIRPRGLHLDEPNARLAGEPVAGSLFDFGLFAFHSARALLERGSHPYLYLPKLEHHLEARWWNEVLAWSEGALGMPAGSFRATVLIETLPAAFQMTEILFELRDHSLGLNAGRWDYIFSAIKSFRDDSRRVLPDRSRVTMTVPFMRAYTELLVRTCHERGTFAMGGMAALIPSRRDEEANQRALEAVRQDKRREAEAGFDGTWVAHPDLVPVAEAEFGAVLGDRPNQVTKLRDDVAVGAAELLDLESTPGEVTEEGLRDNLSVGFRYISFWLAGRGAAAINNLMEDTATAEISRAQVWQWIRHGVRLPDGRPITRDLVLELLDEETARIRAEVGDEVWDQGHPAETRRVLERVCLEGELPPFLTVVALDDLQALNPA